MNTGERDEILAKIRVTQIRDERIILPEWGVVIESVGGSIDKDYGTSPWAYNSGHPALNISESELENAKKDMGIKKAEGKQKADVFINNWGVSLKSSRSKPPSLINHTTRPGLLRVCEETGVNHKKLDDIIQQYWLLRKKGLIKEDVKNTDKNSPFRKEKEHLIPIIQYFLFEGTGGGRADSPADCVMVFKSPLNLGSSRIIYNEPEEIDKIWDKLRFSVVSHNGMPKNYPNEKNRKDHPSVKIWTEFFQGSYKGALHLRMDPL